MGILARPDKVKRIISDVATNNKKGSRELAIIALGAFLSAAPAEGTSKGLYMKKILSIADEISQARPSMAIIANVACKIKGEFKGTKEVELPGECYRMLRDLVKKEKLRLCSIEENVARHFIDHFPKLRKPLVFSYSSTLVFVIKAMGKKCSVLVCESRPALEGRKTARLIAGSAKSIRLITEAQIPMAMEKCDSVLFGCDCIFPDGSVVNKVGSRLLSGEARDSGRPVIVLGDTYKLLPAVRKVSEEHPPGEIWKSPPRGVEVVNEYFERIPPPMIDYIVTEKGVFHTGELKKLIKLGGSRKRK